MVQQLDQVMIEIPGDEHSKNLCQVVQYLLLGDFDAALDAAAPGTLGEQLVQACMSTKSVIESTTDATIQRAHTIIDLCSELLAKIEHNNDDSNLARWVKNLTISGVRMGLTAVILTTCRQLIGFALEKNLTANAATPLTRNAMSAIALAIGPALNILGAIRDECNGTGNTQTRLALAATLTLSMAALALTAAAPSAMPALAAYGTQTAFYSFANDLVSLFFPITDNSKANLGGTAASGALNGVLQFLAFTGMNYAAPNSGPGYVMSQGSKPTTTEPQTFASQLATWFAQNVDSAESRSNEIGDLAIKLEHDVRRGAFNAGADVVLQVIGGEMMHAFQGEKTDTGFRISPPSARIPTVEQVLNQFLSTSAIRTSTIETVITVVISATRFFSTLPIPKPVVDHIVNALVAAVFFASRPGTVYVNERTAPHKPV